jgi:cytochrome oxidase Cu insertion factor (SCO1/SenC/PrrC family)
VNSTLKRLQWITWGGIALTIAALVLAFIIKERRKSGAGTNLANPNATGGPLPVLFEVPDFALTNQSGQVITRSSLRGQLWLADIVFTRCAGPCPEMTRRMAELQSAIPANEPVRFVTLTTDPVNDTPPVLQAFARRFGAQAERWHFLTGTKKQIIDLAVRGLKFTALDKEASQQENPNDLFIHSTIFVLMDKQGRARAVFESDDEAMKPKVLAAIARLLEEAP